MHFSEINQQPEQLLSRSQLQAIFFDILDDNRLIFVVLNGRFQIQERRFDVLFWPQQYTVWKISLQMMLLIAVRTSLSDTYVEENTLSGRPLFSFWNLMDRIMI